MSFPRFLFQPLGTSQEEKRKILAKEAPIAHELGAVANVINPFNLVGTLISDLQKAGIILALGGIAAGAAYFSLHAEDPEDH